MKTLSAAGVCLALIALLGVVLHGCNTGTVQPGGGTGVFFPAETDKTSAKTTESTRPLADTGLNPAAAAESGVTAASTPAASTEKAADPVTSAAQADIPLSQPPRPTQTRSKRALAGQNSLYDRSNPAYERLQKANQALAGFPADNSGQVDWVAALRQGKIKPRATVRGQGKMEIRQQELIMKNTREMPWVRFPHEAHTQWLACSNCHDRIFKPVQGTHKITMDDIFRGRYCGVCHDRVSFSVVTCERCHSVVHPDSPRAWWTQ